MIERGSRVDPEPNLSGDHVTITVRHVSMENKTRLFKGDCKMVQVYDWVGGLNSKPEYFELLNFQQQAVPPEKTVVSGVFNMVESEKAILMSPTGGVAFRGFGTSLTSIHDAKDHYENLEML